MIKIVKKKIIEYDSRQTGRKETVAFIVADHKGVDELRHGELATRLEMEFLSCGHYIFPALGTHAHARVNCPICGSHHTLSGYTGVHEYMNGKKSEVFAIHTEVIGHDKATQKLINDVNKVIVGKKYLV